MIFLSILVWRYALAISFPSFYYREEEKPKENNLCPWIRGQRPDLDWVYKYLRCGIDLFTCKAPTFMSNILDILAFSFYLLSWTCIIVFYLIHIKDLSFSSLFINLSLLPPIKKKKKNFMNFKFDLWMIWTHCFLQVILP